MAEREEIGELHRRDVGRQPRARRRERRQLGVGRREDHDVGRRLAEIDARPRRRRSLPTVVEQQVHRDGSVRRSARASHRVAVESLQADHDERSSRRRRPGANDSSTRPPTACTTTGAGLPATRAWPLIAQHAVLAERRRDARAQRIERCRRRTAPRRSCRNRRGRAPPPRRDGWRAPRGRPRPRRRGRSGPPARARRASARCARRPAPRARDCCSIVGERVGADQVGSCDSTTRSAQASWSSNSSSIGSS